jgi:hypothetical protein
MEKIKIATKNPLADPNIFALHEGEKVELKRVFH